MANEQSPQKKSANLSVDQMQSGIARIEKRIAELEAFDIKNIYEEGDAAIGSLRMKTNTTLQDILDNESLEYEDYELQSFDFYCPLDDVENIRSHYQNQLSRAALKLKALKEVLEERIAHAVPSQEHPVSQPSPTPNTGKVFIVHGHDHGLKDSVARFITKLGLEPVILHEQLDQSRTVIEKLLDHAVEADYAIALFTPDDIGYPVNNPDDRKHRARQNVVLELGLFLGFLGRKRVALLHTGDVDIPSDFSGVLYVKLDGVGAWETKLAGEMKKSGMAVDLNNLIGI